MTTKIKVVRPFVYSHEATEKAHTYSKEFAVGVHEIPDEMAAHPWVIAGADGAIEVDERKAKKADAKAEADSPPATTKRGS